MNEKSILEKDLRSAGFLKVIELEKKLISKLDLNDVDTRKFKEAIISLYYLQDYSKDEFVRRDPGGVIVPSYDRI